MEKRLELETRRKIFELLENEPGLSFREIARRLVLPLGSATYHLRYMVKHEILVSIQDGNRKRFYPKDRSEHEERAVLAVLRNEMSRGLVLFLLLNPDSTFQKISRNVDIPPSTLSYHLEKLVIKEILERERRGRQTRYRVMKEDLVASVLISYRPSFLEGVVDAFIDAWTRRGEEG